MIAATIVIAVATVAMVGVAYCQYRQVREIAKRDDERQEQQRDLYKAVVIATILSGPSSVGDFERAITVFKTKYDASGAKSRIF